MSQRPRLTAPLRRPDRLANLVVALGLVALAMPSAPVWAQRSHPAHPGLSVGYTPGPPIPEGFGQRWNFVSGFFPPANQLVVFGGAPIDLTTSWHNDTWLFVPGVGWSEGPAAPPSLTPRGGGAMAFDPDIRKLVMFGGEARDADGTEVWPPYTNDTWLWDGSTWSKGPPAPPALEPRTGAQMVYDDALHAIVLFGGSGLGRYTDTWLFDGHSWTPGPPAPLTMQPRVFFGMAYDSLVHKVVMGGGDGQRDVWLFDGSSWSPGPSFPDDIANSERERTRMVFDPTLGATLLFGGVGPGRAEEEIYYLRLAPPVADWALVPQAAPVPGPESPPAGRLDGGIAWVPSLNAVAFFGGVQAGYSGRLSYRDLRFFRDVPPVTSSVSLSPDPPFQAVGLNATLGEVQGGYFSTSASVRWFKNGRYVPGESGKHLDPKYRPGDTIRAQVRIIDSLGLRGPWVTSNTVMVARPEFESSNGVPGGTVLVSGRGYGAGEPVDLRLDSPTGSRIGTVTADGFGSFFDQAIFLPNPLSGGSHQVYAIGADTQTMALPVTITVTPGAAVLEPSDVAAGQATTFSAAGFLPGENVAVSFPGGPTVSGPADENGSIVAGLVSPPEPAPGGDVTASAASGSTAVRYSAIPVLTVTGTPVPGAVPFFITGFGHHEVVLVSTSNGLVVTGQTDASGSAQAVVTGHMTFGTMTLTASGIRTGTTAQTTITMDASMTVEPSSGPSGTMVAIDSGPGWAPFGPVAYYQGSRLIGVFAADHRGRIHVRTPVLGSPGVVTITLMDQVLGQIATADFTVTG